MSLLRRVKATARGPVPFTIDGEPCTALDGDTVLTAILTTRSALRFNEFSGEPRAGFCLMGVCQDCWIADAGGRPLRACSVLVEPGMALVLPAGTRRDE